MYPKELRKIIFKMLKKICKFKTNKKKNVRPHLFLFSILGCVIFTGTKMNDPLMTQ